MADTTDVGGNFWGYLVNSDKTAAPLLEQLCLGLVYIIRRLGNSPDDKLTPERLAAFYRSVGGHFDALFLGSNDPNVNAASRFAGLSFMYRTLGCYHSLEPTPNAFETPCIPCLTPAGFVRWQTIQLLLCPDEHAVYLQKAVQVYDVPRPDGRMFAKNIPRDAFPDKPDVDMDKWHKKIESQLSQEYMHTLKNSPYSSPAPQSAERTDGYFGSQIPQIRRPSRTSRERSSEEDRLRPKFNNRRSSVPDLISPGTTSNSNDRPPSSFQIRDSRRRSASAQRDTNNLRPRATTNGYAMHQRNSSSSSQRDTYDRPDHAPQRHPPYSRHHSNSKFRFATAEEDPSGSEASSEGSADGMRRRPYGPSLQDPTRQRGLLMPVQNPLAAKRRHSHDAGVLSKPDKTRRDDSRAPRTAPAVQADRSLPTVRFKEDIFGAGGIRSDSPTFEPRFGPSRRSDTFPRSPASNGAAHAYPTPRDTSSSSGSDRRNGYDMYRGAKNKEMPLRVATMTGVGGRKYANAEPNSPGRNGDSDGPSTRDPRPRYSVAV